MRITNLFLRTATLNPNVESCPNFGVVSGHRHHRLFLGAPGSAPRDDAPHALEHFVIFAATGFAFGLGYGSRYLIPIGLVVFAGAIELAQLLVPGRHARLSDFVVDALAACIGFLASYVARKLEVTVDPDLAD